MRELREYIESLKSKLPKFDIILCTIKGIDNTMGHKEIDPNKIIVSFIPFNKIYNGDDRKCEFTGKLLNPYICYFKLISEKEDEMIDKLKAVEELLC